jgi:hypothetical protein
MQQEHVLASRLRACGLFFIFKRAEKQGSDSHSTFYAGKRYPK